MEAPTTVSNWRQYAASGQRMGPANAPVTIVEFSDYQCPFCKQMETRLDSLRIRMPRRVAVIYRHFPLEQAHPHAFTAALAAECAGEQRRFEAYHRLLFAHQDSIGITPWATFARDAQVPDTTAFSRCVAEKRHQERIAGDLAAGRALDLRGTPMLLINGLKVNGLMPTADLERYIAEAKP